METNWTTLRTKALRSELVIYHAGSLAVPFAAIKAGFAQLYPAVQVKLVAGGSAQLARVISEAGEAVDIFVSADYTVIEQLLMPEHAGWNALFANNSMVIIYSERSKYADEITSSNWYEILLRPGVNFGHSEPNLDPCGYRTVLLWQLAEKHYQQVGLFAELTKACSQTNITPKADQLITLLEEGKLDYIFEYESVARQNVARNPALRYLKLPAEINLSAIEHAALYRTASMELTGANPGETLTVYGEPIVYSLTMPQTGKNPELAVEFLKYFFTEGLKILEEQGQPTMAVQVKGLENVPTELRTFF